MHPSLSANLGGDTGRPDVRRAACVSKLGGAAALAFAIVLAGCASVPEATIEQPDLTALVQPYAARLAAEGVSRIEVPGAGYISVGTPYGFFEIAETSHPRRLSSSRTPRRESFPVLTRRWTFPSIAQRSIGSCPRFCAWRRETSPRCTSYRARHTRA